MTKQAHRVFVVDECRECPHFALGNGGCVLKKWRRMPDINKIPDWCPLEDKVDSTLNKVVE